MPHIPYFALVVIASTLTVACNPREMPGIKQLGRREEARITRETDEAIKTSPAFQQLNELCTREIPVPDGFVLANKSRGVNEPRFLSYGYRASIDYETVKRFYLGYLPSRGWQLKEQKDGGWGPSKLVFRKEGFEVIIYDKEYGDDSIYFVECAKL